MEFMGKDLEKIVVTLPMADGTEMDCGVFSYFEIDGKRYFALLPLLEDGKTFDFSQSYMLYRVEEDEENNPVVLYIEDDAEYATAARCFSEQILHKRTS